MALIGRILIILVAFFAASLAAGIVVVFSIVFPEWGSGRFGFDEGSFPVVATIGFVVIGSFGFLPCSVSKRDHGSAPLVSDVKTMAKAIIKSHWHRYAYLPDHTRSPRVAGRKQGLLPLLSC